MLGRWGNIKVEPYWNVNVKVALYNLLNKTIKVEPYWNVNCHLGHRYTFTYNIKVEPYWNVNFDNFSLLLK